MPKYVVSKRPSKRLTSLEAKRRALLLKEEHIEQKRYELACDLKMLDFLEVHRRDSELAQLISQAQKLRGEIRRAEAKLLAKKLRG